MPLLIARNVNPFQEVFQWTFPDLSKELLSGSYVSLCAILCLVTQSCLTLCDPTDCSLSGSSDHGIFQARIWNVLPFPPTSEDLPDPGNGSASLVSLILQADSLRTEPLEKTKHYAYKTYLLSNKT